MNNLQKRIVYLPVNGETEKCVCIDHPGGWRESVERVVEQEGFFFTPEQFNEHNQNVIKQTLETAAEKVTVKESRSFTGVRTGSFYASKESITNTFEETYRLFSVE